MHLGGGVEAWSGCGLGRPLRYGHGLCGSRSGSGILCGRIRGVLGGHCRGDRESLTFLVGVKLFVFLCVFLSFFSENLKIKPITLTNQDHSPQVPEEGYGDSNIRVSYLEKCPQFGLPQGYYCWQVLNLINLAGEWQMLSKLVPAKLYSKPLKSLKLIPAKSRKSQNR